MAMINMERFRQQIKTSAELIKRINIDKDHPEYYAAAYTIDALENSEKEVVFDDVSALTIEINAHLNILSEKLGAIFDHQKALNLALQSIECANDYETRILMEYAKFSS